MMRMWGQRLRRARGRSATELARRLMFEFGAQADRWRAPPAAKLSAGGFAARFGEADLETLWETLLARPFAVPATPMDRTAYEALCPGDAARIADAAESARSRRADLLGSGPVRLGAPIDWHRDFKSGHVWPVAFFRDIDVLGAGHPSDIKMPWELSRLQWVVPVGQAYLLTAEDSAAAFVRDVLEEWIAANPYGRGPNWASAMEAAMRVFTWGWLFHVFGASAPWRDDGYRLRFLKVLHSHAVFIARHLEDFGINGNHLTADAAGLVVAGHFFGGGEGEEWAERGWRILRRELPRQVLRDGVTFEASTSYHRLVAELVFVAVAQRRAVGRAIDRQVFERLGAMGDFTAAYTRPDGSAPAWGDGDDGRVLPFGGQAIADHSYLPALLAGLGAGVAAQRPTARAVAELVWALGPESAVRALPGKTPETASAAFADSGVYVLRGGSDHVYVDAGPVGMGGLGGHGHNDCLSLEAVLTGVALLTDSGTYGYTGDLATRDRFRGTAAHNTPMVGGIEQNDIPPGEPFRLADQLAPRVRLWQPGDAEDLLVAGHDAYMRLASGVQVDRAVLLDKRNHRLAVADKIGGAGEHMVRVPFHFAPGVTVVEQAEGNWQVAASGRRFWFLVLESGDWNAVAETGEFSPSYGVTRPRSLLIFERSAVPASLTVALVPSETDVDAARAWLAEVAARAWSESGIS